MIIHNDTLWRARENFSSSAEFSRFNWEKYPKHNYARFIVYQTWIEYINRLLGALMGVLVLCLFIASFSWRKQNKTIVLLSLLMMLLTGFQAWLGAMVVSSNLAPVRVTAHMLAALILLTINQLIIHKSNYSIEKPMGNKSFLKENKLGFLILILMVIQILMGTKVRENIDNLAIISENLHRETWIDRLPIIFNVHRSFSILVLILSFFNTLILSRRDEKRALQYAKYTTLIIIAIIVSGIGLNYAGFPLIIQPLHLLLAMIIFSCQLESWLRIRKTNNSLSG